jgi:hypothetical protein
MTTLFKTVSTPKFKQKCDGKNNKCKKKATHKMKIASSSTKRISYLYYCDYHFADLYSGIFLGADQLNR